MKFTVQNLRCEYLENPLGIDTAHPRFSWILKSSKRGQCQTAYRILVASICKKIEEDDGDMWDTGKIESDRAIGIEYGGESLKSGEKYYWKVRTWDESGQPSPWSKVATFQLGLLKGDEWEGEWIGAEDNKISAPLIRKEFKLDKEIEQAYAYISGLGYYELYINGDKVGDQVLDPGTTDYSKRVLYATYDVTNCLNTGANALGVMLGHGWFSTPEQVLKQSPAQLKRYGDRPKLILQLNVKFSDGTAKSIATDGSWFCVPSREKVDLSRRQALRRILAHMLRARLDEPGRVISSDEVLAAGWPGERVIPRAGASRVYVAIRTLRKFGLRDFIVTSQGGYLLHSAVEVIAE